MTIKAQKHSSRITDAARERHALKRHDRRTKARKLAKDADRLAARGEW